MPLLLLLLTPTGEVVRTLNSYRDTLRYTSNSDSLVRIVVVRVTSSQLLLPHTTKRAIKNYKSQRQHRPNK